MDGTEYQSNNTYVAMCPKTVVDILSGQDISGIIGMDVIKATGLTVDYANGEVLFESKKGTALCSFRNYFGVAMTSDFIVNGRKCESVIIDTGASVPYLSRSLLNENDITEQTYSDYSPLLEKKLVGNYYRVNIVSDLIPDAVFPALAGKGEKEMDINNISGILNLKMFAENNEIYAPKKTASVNFTESKIYIM